MLATRCGEASLAPTSDKLIASSLPALQVPAAMILLRAQPELHQHPSAAPIPSAMLPTTIRSPPSLEDYIPLAEYQSQTPASFSDSKPVLHFHLKAARASIPKSQCGTLAVFPADSPAADNATARTNGETEVLVEQAVEVFVNSE